MGVFWITTVYKHKDGNPVSYTFETDVECVADFSARMIEHGHIVGTRLTLHPTEDPGVREVVARADLAVFTAALLTVQPYGASKLVEAAR